MKLLQLVSFQRDARHAAIAAGLVLAGFGASAPALAATASAATSAEVVAPISIESTADLSFGRFVGLPGAGAVVISNSGVRTFTGTTLAAGTQGTVPAAARFAVTGDGTNTYSINLSNTALVHTVTASNTMALTTTSDLTGANVIAGSVTAGALTGGAQTIYVGGTLVLGTTQPAGTYVGSVTATVEYN